MLFGWRSRVAVIGIIMALTVWAAPTLVTIQDVLYKADGSRFNGQRTQLPDELAGFAQLNAPFFPLP